MGARGESVGRDAELMAGGISIHVVDVSRGVVAVGMHVEVHACEPRRLIAAGALSSSGVLAAPALAAAFAPGYYEAVFHAGNYYRAAGVALPAVAFVDVVTFCFGIDRADQHYHLPMKMTPWGYSCFRGGA